MMTTSQEAIQKSITRSWRSVHQRSFLWALFQEFVRSTTTQRFVAASGAGLPFSEIAAIKPRSSSLSLAALEA